MCAVIGSLMHHVFGDQLISKLLTPHMEENHGACITGQLCWYLHDNTCSTHRPPHLTEFFINQIPDTSLIIS